MGHRHPASELGPAYNITVVGRTVAVTEAMKQHALDKLHKIDRYSPRTVDVTVTMDVTRAYHRCDITMRFNHLLVKVHSTTSDMYASIDLAVKRLRHKLERYHEKLTDHDHREVLKPELLEEVVLRGPPSDEDLIDEINEEIVQENERRAAERFQLPQVSDRGTWHLKTLNLNEAMMQIDLSRDPFLLYRSEEDRKVRCLYWRPDGNLGLMQVEA
jgi:putative sigma-54 modulation protein